MSIDTDTGTTPVAGTLDDRTKDGMIAELKQLRTQLSAAEKVINEFGTKRQVLEAALRAYGVNPDALVD